MKIDRLAFIEQRIEADEPLTPLEIIELYSEPFTSTKPLSPLPEEVIKMYHAGASYVEIAQVMGVHASCVRSRFVSQGIAPSRRPKVK
jgi:hypothetical protein